MKKIFTYLFLLFAITSQAQPTLNSTNMAPYGSEFFYKHVSTFAAIDTTIQGANVTWDFSTIGTSADPDFTITVFDPAQTVHASTFPTANYGWIEGPDMDYAFFENSPNQLMRIGGWDSVDGYSLYSDPQIDIMFPLTSTSSWSDSSLIIGNSFPSYLECQGKGYGTIMVPGGLTYTNVIMVRVMLDILIFQVEQYLWYNSATGQPVFTYVPGDGGFIPEAAAYLYNTTSGISENDFITGIKYNNPCTNDLNIAYVSKDAIATEYELMNSLGAVVQKGMLDKSTMQRFTLDISNELPGLYLLTIKDAGNTQNVKTVKVIKM